jgi:hypothetical protein
MSAVIIHVSRRFVVLAFALLLLAPYAAHAQNQATPAAASSDQLLTPEELDALVARIALYPDALLAEILMASTYPLEVVEADRWAKANKNLKGDQLRTAVDKQSWDDSVKSLAATPDVLSMMSGKLDWTQKLGNAVLAQQPDVMDAIQRPAHFSLPRIAASVLIIAVLRSIVKRYRDRRVLRQVLAAGQPGSGPSRSPETRLLAMIDALPNRQGSESIVRQRRLQPRGIAALCKRRIASCHRQSWYTKRATVHERS